MSRKLCFSILLVQKQIWLLYLIILVWIDIDVTTHISITIQDCFRSRLLIDGEKYIYMGCDKKARIEAICVFRFYLGTNIFLDLKNTFIVPSLR